MLDISKLGHWKPDRLRREVRNLATRLAQASPEMLNQVEREQVEARAIPSIDGTRRLFEVRWTSGTAIASGVDVIERARQRGALAASAMLLGVADRLIVMAAGYAKEREQLGKPIGSFQAVKHHLADALVRLAFARPVVYRAAHSVARDSPERARDVSMAKALASEAGIFAARVALQVHGAIGYTQESDLHLWMKRAWALAAAWGNAALHRERVRRALLER